MFFFVSCSNKNHEIIQADTHKNAALKFISQKNDHGQIICVSHEEINYENVDSQLFFHANSLTNSQNFKVVY